MKRIFTALLACCDLALAAQEMPAIDFDNLEAIEMPERLISRDITPAAASVARIDVLPDRDDMYTIESGTMVKPMAKDYSLSVSIATCADDNQLPLVITVGSDIKTVKYLCYENFYSSSTSNLEFVAQYGDEIDSEDYASMVLTLTTERNSRFTLFVTGLDKNGNYQTGVTAYFYSINDNDSDWVTVGTSTFCDDMLASIYSSIYTSVRYNVTIQENVKTPGYYRLVNPYGRGYSYYYKNSYSHSHNHYIYIHAEDPDAVYIEESPICMNLGYGGISVASLAIPGWSTENTAPYVGRLDPSTHTVKFPAKSLVVAQQNYNNGTWYRANNNALTYFTIPYIPDPEEQSIVWNQTFGTAYVGDVIELNATATSGLPVEYRIAGNGHSVATLNGNKLTMIGGGSVTVIASQPGDGELWNPAPEVSRTITCSDYTAGDLFVVGDFNDWTVSDDYRLTADRYMLTLTLPANALYGQGTPVAWHIQTALGDVVFGLGDEVGEGGSRITCGGGNNLSDIRGTVTVILFIDDDSWAPEALVDMTLLVVDDGRPVGTPDSLYVIGEIYGAIWQPHRMQQLTRNGNVFSGIVEFVGPTFLLCEHPGEDANDWMGIGYLYGPESADRPILFDYWQAVVGGNSESPFVIGDPDAVFPMMTTVTVDFENNLMMVHHEPELQTGITDTYTDAEPTTYYNLQGVRIARPAAGTVCIAVSADGTASTTVVR